MTRLAEEYQDLGYDGVYLDNVDAYIVLEESSPPWAQGVDLKDNMINLIKVIRENISGLVYINLGGALEDLRGGAQLSGIINGSLREEVLYYSTGNCTNQLGTLRDILPQLWILALAKASGIDVLVVEFVHPGHQALIAATVHTLLGLHPILQPACSPDYTQPPIILGKENQALHYYPGNIIKPHPT